MSRKVLILPGGGPAVCRYRFERPAAQLGLELVKLKKKDLLVEEGDAFKRAEALGRWYETADKSWDLIWTSEWGPEFRALYQMEKDRGVELLVDVDDWFSDIPRGNPARAAFLGRRRIQYQKLLRQADRVSCSTPTLAAEHGGLVTPNFVDPAEWDYPERPGKDPDQVVVLIAAGLGRVGDFLWAEKALVRAAENPNVKVVFMGWEPKWVKRFPVGRTVFCTWQPYEQKPWGYRYHRMVRWLAPDVVLSPLEHNVFNSAKSHLKWMEAAMAGAAFLGERWGEYERLVEDGETGVLAAGIDEWADKLEWLCQDHVARRRIAAAGRAEVLARWTWDAVAPAWRAAVLGEGVSDGASNGGSADGSSQLDLATAAN